MRDSCSLIAATTTTTKAITSMWWAGHPKPHEIILPYYKHGSPGAVAAWWLMWLPLLPLLLPSGPRSEGSASASPPQLQKSEVTLSLVAEYLACRGIIPCFIEPQGDSGNPQPPTKPTCANSSSSFPWSAKCLLPYMHRARLQDFASRRAENC